MSYFKGLKLTRQGEQLLAKVNGNIGEILTFTRGELGSGRIDSEDEVYYLTALKNKWGELAITEITRTGEDETQVRIETQFTNAEWTEEKILREIGIYAKGKESSEILFAYSNAGENYDKIPIPQDNPQSFLIGITFKISTATKVDATISFSGFVTIEKLEEELAKKEDKISTKNTAFNKNFGVLEGEVLEGHRLAQALGLEFAGELNNVNLKQAGKAYWDNVNKSIYKCLVDNTLNYAESTKFEALSNHDLLLKLQNLHKYSYFLCDVDTIITKNEKVTTYKNMTNNLNLSHNNGLFIFNQPGIYKVDITYNISGLNSYRDLNLKVVKSDGKIQYAGVIINTSSGAVAESVSGTVSVILNSKEVDNFYITANTSSLEATQIRFVKEQNFILITKLN